MISNSNLVIPRMILSNARTKYSFNNLNINIKRANKQLHIKNNFRDTLTDNLSYLFSLYNLSNFITLIDLMEIIILIMRGIKQIKILSLSKSMLLWSCL